MAKKQKKKKVPEPAEHTPVSAASSMSVPSVPSAQSVEPDSVSDALLEAKMLAAELAATQRRLKELEEREAASKQIKEDTLAVQLVKATSQQSIPQHKLLPYAAAMNRKGLVHHLPEGPQRTLAQIKEAKSRLYTEKDARKLNAINQAPAYLHEMLSVFGNHPVRTTPEGQSWPSSGFPHCDVTAPSATYIGALAQAFGISNTSQVPQSITTDVRLLTVLDASMLALETGDTEGLEASSTLAWQIANLSAANKTNNMVGKGVGAERAGFEAGEEGELRRPLNFRMKHVGASSTDEYYKITTSQKKSKEGQAPKNKDNKRARSDRQARPERARSRSRSPPRRQDPDHQHRDGSSSPERSNGRSPRKPQGGWGKSSFRRSNGSGNRGGGGGKGGQQARKRP